MRGEKEALRQKFSAEYKKYYLVDLFKREGYVRKKCENCGKFFWTLNHERKRCDDQPCSPYSFIDNPPTKVRFDRIGAWKSIESFFIKNKHTSIRRYPVVSRWRPDLFFTVASIIDFQRIEGGKVVFQLPANPLIVPQVCLRFNDISSVGVSGKHYTSFVMVGQHSIANKDGYWKDKCIDLDFELLTKIFGIRKEEISFIEDVWLGYGAFGYSLEYFVRGLELGNAVFTAFEGTPTNYRPMKEKVVDMGAGLERLTWITQGTPTSYDSSFSFVLNKMKELCKVDYNEELFMKYSKLAGKLNMDEFKSLNEAREVIAKELGIEPSLLLKEFGPVEAIYAIADHAQTLLFAIADGMLPSNSGGGYNLRILFRRAMNFIKRYNFPIDLIDVINWHIDYLSKIYSELEDHREDVAKILSVENTRYLSSTQRIAKVISSLRDRSLSTEDLIQLYDSEGVTPEQLIEAGIKVKLPEDFYEKVTARHTIKRVEEERPRFNLSGISPTRLLFYINESKFDFTAKVLKVIDGKYVILDRTYFYPRGGGQEPDHGTINNAKVVDVERYGDIVLHKLDGELPKEGSLVSCHVDESRRRRITKIHTATHILNGSSRAILGPWVWQHSAFKEENYGRLDITHYAHLTYDEIMKIEDLANEIVRKNMQVCAKFMPRKEAEEKYGFRLYQGGVFPSKILRVVNIGDWDIEACGGTHTRNTAEVGLIKIVKTERVQDGVERIEFVAGEAAMDYIHKMDKQIEDLASLLGVSREGLTKAAKSIKEELELARSRERFLREKLAELSIPVIINTAKELKGIKLYIGREEELKEEEIIAQGEKVVKREPKLVFVNFSKRDNSVRIICFVGKDAASRGISATDIVKKASLLTGGSGGGSNTFAQGGGPFVNKVDEATNSIEQLITSVLG